MTKWSWEKDFLPRAELPTDDPQWEEMRDCHIAVWRQYMLSTRCHTARWELPNCCRDDSLLSSGKLLSSKLPPFMQTRKLSLLTCCATLVNAAKHKKLQKSSRWGKRIGSRIRETMFSIVAAVDDKIIKGIPRMFTTMSSLLTFLKFLWLFLMRNLFPY